MTATSPALLELIAASVARVKAMTPEEREAMFDEQRASWVRGEMGMSGTAVITAGLMANASTAAINLRTNQRQLDADGCEVGVSRQALEEVLAELEQLHQLRLEANIPVKYFHSNDDGSGCTYAVYGTSSITYVELLRARLALTP